MTNPPDGPEAPSVPDDADNVISLGAHRIARMTPAIAQIEAYWQALRDGRLVPDRADIDPRGLDGALEYAFVLERIAPGLARFRVAGRHMNDLMGLETRAMPISAVFLPDARRELAQALDAVFEEPAVVRLDLSADGGFGRSTLSGQMILLPVRGERGTVDRILGGLAMSGDVGRRPRRLKIEALHHRTLIGYGIERPRAQRSDAGGDCRTRPNLTIISSDS